MKKQPVSSDVHPLAQPESAVLLGEVRVLIDRAREYVAKEANSTLTMLYWQIGQRIRSEVLQDGRGEYGERIVSALSTQLVADYGKGFA